MRCTHCYYEFDLSQKEVRLLEKQNSLDSVCPVKKECHTCHIGFMIPVNYSDRFGNQFLFHEIKPKIKNLDHNTVIKRIIEHSDPDNMFFFGPDD